MQSPGETTQAADRRTRDAFNDWLLSNNRWNQMTIVQQKLTNDKGMVQLQDDMRHESMHFKGEYLAHQPPEVIFENRICFSQYGLHVRRLMDKQHGKKQSRPS